jgi:hypothetical protein
MRNTWISGARPSRAPLLLQLRAIQLGLQRNTRRSVANDACRLTSGLRRDVLLYMSRKLPGQLALRRTSYLSRNLAWHLP